MKPIEQLEQALRMAGVYQVYREIQRSPRHVSLGPYTRYVLWLQISGNGNDALYAKAEEFIEIAKTFFPEAKIHGKYGLNLKEYDYIIGPEV